ncbi:LpxL/LpxP family Kdo(2)-lipid IV(A) lauroyl/palmitoleoyl acyltransferase [Zhongshania sp. BJYM1]|uniref:LpxL/LpxP family Kdo(2)-lipid IV(A) lauroyl/palmitoleoyl acyltransferase n=1 Tax=Zhongshania aquatica TaxID=2965069 RepID=UPI0022B5AE42|nr:LpxL/LpxP family Kdo(2)-lipid IV(A) lauroyl/palmitoleoyl acyltransferase [Marortus sp. BJYM1]
MTIERQLLYPRHWLTWCGIGLLWSLAHLPRRLSYALGAGIGNVFYCLAKRRRHICETNLRLCFPELSSAEFTLLVKKTMRNQGVGLMETLRVWFIAPEKLGVEFELIGKEHLEVPEGGSGIIIIATHFTSLDVCGTLVGGQYPSDSFYRKHKNPVFEYILSRSRGRYGEPIHRRDIKRALKRLREGRRLYYLPDQDYGRKSAEFVPFFGIPAATTIGTSTLAKGGRARVVYANQQRLDSGRRYRVEIIPMDNFPSGDPVADARAINAILEENILMVPEQYMWVHRRFKTRPVGEAGFYE